MIDLHSLVGDWDKFLMPILEDRKVLEDLNTINRLYKSSNKKIYPEQIDVFKAFKECPYSKLSVVILLQDPYHDGSATGIAAANSVDKPLLSPSLKIIKDTVSREVYKGMEFDFDPTLIKWERQGVILLNTALTVEEGFPLSHQSLWARFTQMVLSRLSEINSGIIYCLWGKYADGFSKYINNNSNTILRCHHPVYASYRGVPWVCTHFNDINDYLKKYNNFTINW